MCRIFRYGHSTKQDLKLKVLRQLIPDHFTIKLSMYNKNDLFQKQGMIIIKIFPFLQAESSFLTFFQFFEHFVQVTLVGICTFGFRDLHKKLFYLDLDTKEIRKYFFHELSCVYFFLKSYIYSNFHDICHNLNKNPKTMNRCLHIWMYLA